MGSDGNDLVSLDAAAGVEEQHCKAFAFRVEIRVVRKVQAPVFGGFVRGVAKLQRLGRGAFAEGYDFVFVGLAREAERYY